MRFKSMLAAAAAIAVSCMSATGSQAAVSYVKSCVAEGGVGSLYIPGTNTCLNMNDVAYATAGYPGVLDSLGKANEGVAIGYAMPMPFIPDGKTFAVTGHWGNFEGSNALALGAVMKLNDNLYLSGGVGVGLDYGTVGSRAGFMIAW